MLVMDSTRPEDDFLISRMNNNNHPVIIKSQSVVPSSWHPHVYAIPPKTPTPHLIADILGLGGSTSGNTDEPLNLTTRCRSPTQRPGFREPSVNGVPEHSVMNGRLMELSGSPKGVRRNSTQINKGMNDYYKLVFFRFSQMLILGL